MISTSSFTVKKVFGMHLNEELSKCISSEEDLDPTHLKTGAEANAIIKLTSSKGTFVIKQIQPQKAEEEANHIKLINDIYPSFFPKLHALDSNQGIYIMDFIDGVSLERSIKFESILNIPSQDTIFKALEHLSILHKQSCKNYTSNYHEVIVNKRINEIINCPIVNKHCKNINIELLGEIKINNILFSDYLIKVLSFYKKILPTTESIIHGDAHLGNIIAIDSSIKFIDPRISWDSSENKEPGYFDGLYDVACLTHSLIANCILKTSLSDENNQLKIFLNWSMKLLKTYNNSYSLKEKNRYITYLVCCLLGNLSYVEFTPNKDRFMRTVHTIVYLIDKTFIQ